MIINNIPNLKIHKLTQEQYDRARELGQLDENAFYLTPEDENIEQPSSPCELPKVTADDNGASLKVVDGAWAAVTDTTPQLPSVTADDNGAFLRVVDGVWQVVKLADAEGVEF